MTEPLRVILVDDEAPAREGMRIRLRDENVVVTGEFGDAESALKAITVAAPDIVFADIQMSGMSGFELADHAGRGDTPLIVFVTAHDNHAIRAFDANAFDYLLKPVDQTRLRATLAKARDYIERVRKSEVVDQVRGLLRSIDGTMTGPPSRSAAPRVDRIPVRRDGSVQFISPDDVAWIDASGDGVRLRVGRATLSVNKTMGEMHATLNPNQFVRIHRSTIVNIARVRELQPYFHGEYVVVMDDGTTLKLSRGYRADVMRVLGLTGE